MNHVWLVFSLGGHRKKLPDASDPHFGLTRGLWLVSLLVAILWGYHIHTQNAPGYSDASLAHFSIAKGTGFLITAIICVVYLTKLPMLGWLMPRCVAPWFGFTTLHAHAGAIACVAALVHTVFHVVRLGHLKAKPFGEELQTTVTGIQLFVVFAAIGITATRRAAKPALYRYFLNTHVLHYATLPLLLVHCWERKYVYFPLIGLVVLHAAYRYWHTYTTTLEASKNIGETVSRVVKLGNMKATPGTYFLVNVPSISWIEWHPFSLASSKGDGTESNQFLIKELGRWTRKLGATLRKQESEGVHKRVYLQGPYWAPANNALFDFRPVLVASGIGITPFLSVLHEALTAPQHIGKHHVVLLWAVRDFPLVDYFLHHIIDMLSRHRDCDQTTDEVRGGPTHKTLKKVQVKLFYTGIAKGITGIGSNSFVLLHYARLAKKLQGSCNVSFEVVVGRPNLADEIYEADATGVYFCGPNGLAASVKKECKKLHVPFHLEEFQNHTLANIWGVSAPSICARGGAEDKPAKKKKTLAKTTAASLRATIAPPPATTEMPTPLMNDGGHRRLVESRDAHVHLGDGTGAASRDAHLHPKVTVEQPRSSHVESPMVARHRKTGTHGLLQKFAQDDEGSEGDFPTATHNGSDREPTGRTVLNTVTEI